MRRIDWVATVWTITAGLLCLAVVSAGFSGPAWLPDSVKAAVLRWAPAGCLFALIGIGIIMTIPSKSNRRRTP